MSETSPTTIYEVPDAAATAAQAATDYQSGTEDLLGEKMVLNMGLNTSIMTTTSMIFIQTFSVVIY